MISWDSNATRLISHGVCFKNNTCICDDGWTGSGDFLHEIGTGCSNSILSVVILWGIALLFTLLALIMHIVAYKNIPKRSEQQSEFMITEQKLIVVSTVLMLPATVLLCGWKILFPLQSLGIDFAISIVFLIAVTVQLYVTQEQQTNALVRVIFFSLSVQRMHRSVVTEDKLAQTKQQTESYTRTARKLFVLYVFLNSTITLLGTVYHGTYTYHASLLLSRNFVVVAFVIVISWSAREFEKAMEVIVGELVVRASQASTQVEAIPNNENTAPQHKKRWSLKKNKSGRSSSGTMRKENGVASALDHVHQFAKMQMVRCKIFILLYAIYSLPILWLHQSQCISVAIQLTMLNRYSYAREYNKKMARRKVGAGQAVASEPRTVTVAGGSETMNNSAVNQIQRVVSESISKARESPQKENKGLFDDLTSSEVDEST